MLSAFDVNQIRSITIYRRIRGSRSLRTIIIGVTYNVIKHADSRYTLQREDGETRDVKLFPLVLDLQTAKNILLGFQDSLAGTIRRADSGIFWLAAISILFNAISSTVVAAISNSAAGQTTTTTTNPTSGATTTVTAPSASETIQVNQRAIIAFAIFNSVVAFIAGALKYYSSMERPSADCRKSLGDVEALIAVDKTPLPAVVEEALTIRIGVPKKSQLTEAPKSLTSTEPPKSPTSAKPHEASVFTFDDPKDLLTPNPKYEYEDTEIQALLRIALTQGQQARKEKSLAPLPIELIHSIDNFSHPNILFETLRAEAERAAKNTAYPKNRILLIPCNLGQSHWVGLVIRFNEDGKTLASAEYIDSLKNKTADDIPSILQMQLENAYRQRFTFRADCLTQPTGSVDCGPFMIENVLTAAGIPSSYVTPSSTPLEIRKAQLQLMRDYDNPAFLVFSPKQKTGTPTKTGYVPVVSSISEEEKIALLRLALIIKNINNEGLNEAIKRKSGVLEMSNEEHTTHLNQLREALTAAIGVQLQPATGLANILFYDEDLTKTLKDKIFPFEYSMLQTLSALIGLTTHLLKNALNDVVKKVELKKGQIQIILAASPTIIDSRKQALFSTLTTRINVLYSALPAATGSSSSLAAGSTAATEKKSDTTTASADTDHTATAAEALAVKAALAAAGDGSGSLPGMTIA
jgi:hypothetical protein